MSELASPAAPPPADAPTEPAIPSGTTAGTTLAGRYRLRTRVGSDTAAGAEFWRAEDGLLQRDVALTVLRRLDPGTGHDADRAGEMVARALRSGAFEHPGCARLLDVLTPGAPGVPHDVLGAAVTEWVPGRSLAEVVSDGLVKPLHAARAVAPLAAAAEAAHRHGLVLGCDHPQRVRITPEGRAQLSFALPRPDVTPADDVRGLGAVLHTLLTSRWPLSGADAARSGLGAADRQPSGSPVPPSRTRPGVPVELDALVVGSVGPANGPGQVRTAAAVRGMLDEVVAEDDKIALFPPAHDGVPSAPGDVWQDGGKRAPADPRRRRKLLVGLAVLAGAVLLVLGYLGIQLTSAFTDGQEPPIVVGAQVAPSEPGAVAAGGPVDPVAVAGVEVYDRVGDRDGADKVSRVIDGDPGTAWRTSTYRQQFPAFKPGIGVMVSFASAVQLSSVTIDSDSPGTVVQVRSAPSGDVDLDATTVLAEATLADGATEIALTGSQPVTHVLLWVSELTPEADGFASGIGEVRFVRAAG